MGESTSAAVVNIVTHSGYTETDRRVAHHNWLAPHYDLVRVQSLVTSSALNQSEQHLAKLC